MSELQYVVLMLKACRVIELEACDKLKTTKAYRHEAKALVKNLTAFCEKEIKQLHDLIDGREDAELQYYNAVNLIEKVFTTVINLSPQEVEKFNALIEQWNAGEILETSDKIYNSNLQKGAKPLNSKPKQVNE